VYTAERSGEGGKEDKVEIELVLRWYSPGDGTVIGGWKESKDRKRRDIKSGPMKEGLQENWKGNSGRGMIYPEIGKSAERDTSEKIMKTTHRLLA